MTLYLHRAERADRLAVELAELLATPLADVFAEEVVAVPARGVERWLAQQLSLRLGRRTGRADGICAGVRFPSPWALLAQLMGVQDEDPWTPDSLVWPLLEVIDGSAGQPWCATLGHHLGLAAGPGGPAADPAESARRRGRRYAVARRLAGLFDSYAGHRPAMLTDWIAHRDTDGFGRPLPPDLVWQAELWRRVGERISGPDPVSRRSAAVAQVLGEPDLVELPERVSVFGPTRLPPAHLELLTALAVHRDVHLWLPHPSPELWRSVAELPAAAWPLRRRDDQSFTAAHHPLLASLGRDSRELQLELTRTDHVDRHHPLVDQPVTLLTRLQRNLRENRAVDPRQVLPSLDPADRSVRVHACHGPARQVEVLRELLVGLLAEDSTLEPRDMLVMCPDIEMYAPLIAAAFGLADVVEGSGAHPAHRLRVRLADRALTQTNPLLATVARLLDLADGRVTASQVLDLAAWPPVRRRFGFDDDDLDQLARWVAASGVRWGLDAQHRKSFHLQSFGQNTWRAGLDRILLGVAMADEDENRLGLALPLDDVGSGDVDLAGRLAELLDRLQTALDSLGRPGADGRGSLDGAAGPSGAPLQSWLDALSAGVDSLTRVPAEDGWQSAELRREFADILAGAGDRADSILLSLPDVRALLAGRLGGRPTRANFRTGTLTVCTMVPMRSVPHRVVCLLGMDDGVFPRNPRPDGDDILARDPAVGERDARGEDRQLMLDAILAATEHLAVTFSGADERTGAVRPPAVPLGELLDALDETACTPDGSPASSEVLIRHPLQPFDPRSVTPGALGVPGPFSFDPSALAGASALVRPRRPRRPFLPEPLPAMERTDVDLADLIAVLTHPARAFLRQRLDVAVQFDDIDPSDSLTVELDALAQWGIGDRLLRARLAGADEKACGEAEWRRGVLPPGPLGARTLTELLGEVRPLVDRTAELRQPPRRSVDVVVPLTDGRQLRGTVAGVHGTCLLSVGYSKLGPRQQLSAWVGLLALTASDPGADWTAAVVGRGSPGRPRRSSFGPLPANRAREILEQLVDLADRGLREPLPMALKSSVAYAGTRAEGHDQDEAVRRARQAWSSSKFPGEDADHAHGRVWGPLAPLEVLLDQPADPDEQWNAEPTRFGRLAMRLWSPLLADQRLESI